MEHFKRNPMKIFALKRKLGRKQFERFLHDQELILSLKYIF